MYTTKNLIVEIKKLSDTARIPTQGTEYAAGYDLYAAHDEVLAPHERKLIKTNISISIPTGYYGRIAPRSGLAFKNGIDVLAGVIDSDYRGDIGVILYNTDKNSSSYIRTGDRIAQIIIEDYSSVQWNEVSELNSTDRHNKGFGSTGTN